MSHGDQADAQGQATAGWRSPNDLVASICDLFNVPEGERDHKYLAVAHLRKHRSLGGERRTAANKMRS